jgi:pimeloyl-ACP methyl ester carboxylesterase
MVRYRGWRMRRCALVVVVTLIASASAASLAHAAVTWTPCPDPGFQCATVPVPLDPSGAVPGTVNLNVERVVGTTNPTNTAIIALAGGPGQAAVPLADDLADTLKPGLAAQDLMIFDQRGTGKSAPLKCNALTVEPTSDTLASLTDIEAKCANEIGTNRAFFTTAQSVADIEALRVAAGYSKLILFGVSYGTKVAEEYAQTYPQNTAGLILDSVVPPTGPDPLQLSTYTAIPRVLHDLCSGGACAHATPSIGSDLSVIVKRAAAHPIAASVPVLGTGERLTLRVDPLGLFRLLLAGDLNAVLRAELPAALHSARLGDNQPLVRLTADSEGANTGFAAADEAENLPLFLDTTCEESPLPWARTVTGVTERRSLTKAAIASHPTATYAPFSAADVLENGSALTLCFGWPTASPAPTPLGPLPAVHTLVIEGQADLRTTVADAQSVAAQIPGSSLVVVPHNGHSVLTTEQTDCAELAVKAYFANLPGAPCASNANPIPPFAIAPTSLARVHATGRTLQTALAARLTIDDEVREFLAAGIGFDGPVRAGGLRGGYAFIVDKKSMRLVDASYVPGVTVSGSIALKNGEGTVHVSGPDAAHGALHFGPRTTKSGTVTGTLDGHHLHVTLEAAAARAPTTTEGPFGVPRSLPVLLGR